MDINAAFPSKYVKAAEVKGKQIPLTIRTVEMEEMPDKDERPVVYFNETQRGMVLNRTNADTIKEAYGSQTEAWTSKPIVLSTIRVNNPNGGGMVDGLCVTTPAQTPTPQAMPQQVAPAPAQQPAPQAFPSSDVPF